MPGQLLPGREADVILLRCGFHAKKKKNFGRTAISSVLKVIGPKQTGCREADAAQGRENEDVIPRLCNDPHPLPSPLGG